MEFKNSERLAAESICLEELGYKARPEDTTEQLWSFITHTTECFAGWAPWKEKHILNDRQPWSSIKQEIFNSGEVQQLITIYNDHPKLQKHKQFLGTLSFRKNQINAKVKKSTIQ